MISLDKKFFNQLKSSAYTGRQADEEWKRMIQDHVTVEGKRVADIGVGGGIYSIALSNMGAKQVTGIDFSEAMLKAAKINCKMHPNIIIQKGSATETHLDGGSIDIILERALIHHLSSNVLSDAFTEARRILSNKGVYIIQDRTLEDCLLEGSPEHLRGYFFEKFPVLKDKEYKRRHARTTVNSKLMEVGFSKVTSVSLWENRKLYTSYSGIEHEILNRKGRSILHELSDDELKDLVYYIKRKRDNVFPFIEKDRWTIWFAEK